MARSTISWMTRRRFLKGVARMGGGIAVAQCTGALGIPLALAGGSRIAAVSKAMPANQAQATNQNALVACSVDLQDGSVFYLKYAL